MRFALPGGPATKLIEHEHEEEKEEEEEEENEEEEEVPTSKICNIQISFHIAFFQIYTQINIQKSVFFFH